MSKRLIILTGPTAVGKTSLSIKLAKEFGCEIISADSMQVYKGMDIGTAKVTEAEMMGISHHLIDIVEPDYEFNVFEFQKRAKKAIEEIYSRGKTPLIVGGTGFYIQALLYDVDFSAKVDEEYRKTLEAIGKVEGGKDVLYRLLQEIDPLAAQSIHENNIKKVVRALEFFNETGESIVLHNESQRRKKSAFDFSYIVISDDRQKLYDRINTRVEQMFDEGLVKEVQSLLDQGYTREMTSMQGLGYKEVVAYLCGEVSFEVAKEMIKRDTRHFAKRQLTWFRREKEVSLIDKSTFDSEDEFIQTVKKAARYDV